jgi:hypothetical protein
MIPSKHHRELQLLSQAINSMGYYFYQPSRSKASPILLDTFTPILPCLLVNLAMQRANHYRQVVRRTQKKWK